MSVHPSRRLPLAIVLVGCLGTACGSGGGTPATSSGPSAVRSSSASAAPSTAAGSGAPADPATVKAVSTAYTTFFDPASGLATSARYLQHGALFTTSLAGLLAQGRQEHLGARVRKVVLLSPNSAAVTFDLLSAGKLLLPDTPGNAVREHGTWKVAARTFCQLVQLPPNKPPKQCSDPAVVDLPH